MSNTLARPLNLLFLILILWPAPAHADSWQQTDWSGGVDSSTINAYSSSSDIDTTTAGQISIAAATDWVYTAWSYRQNIQITNSADLQTSYPVKLVIPYSAHMQSDFSDLRFARGTTELPFWIEDSESAAQATVWVNIDSLAAASDTEIQMYFGNDAASSESSGEDVFEFFDDFSASEVDEAVWRVNDYSTSMANIVDGELVLTSSASNWNYGMSSLATFARSNLAIEMDYRWESNNSSYDAMMFGWKDDTTTTNYTNLVYGYYNRGTGTCVSNCTVEIYEDANYRSIPSGSVWTQNAETKLRVFLNAASGAVYQQSYDNGENWTTSYTSTYSSESNLHVGFSIHTGQHTFDNVRVRQFLATEPTSTFGSTESRFASSGEITSNIFDTSEWGAVLTSLSYSTDQSENVFVKVRSGNVSDLSDATDFVDCDTVTSGEDLDAYSCVHAGDRYVQYTIELLSSAASTPTVTDVRIEYDSLLTVADAGSATVLASGQSLTLDGTESVGQDLNYSWSIFSGTGELTDRQTANPTFTSASSTSSQSTIITLTVFDAFGHRSSDTVTLSIVATPALQYSDENFSAAKDGLLFLATNTEAGLVQLVETTSGLTLLLPEGLTAYTYAVSDTGVFAVGLPEADDNSGRVYVFHENIADLTGSFSLSETDTADYTVLYGRTAGDAFGTDILFTDLENNADEDLLISAPMASEFGEVSFYDSSLTLYGILAGDSNTAMGNILAAQLYGSDTVDLIFGPYNLAGQSQFTFSDGSDMTPANDVLLFSGDTDFSGSLVPSYLASDVFFSGENDFKTLAAGDLNQDSINDVVLADTEQTIYIFFGPFDAARYSDTDADVIIVADAAETRFAEALQIADVNGDAQNDLIMGSPTAGSTNQGAIYIAFGNSTWDNDIDATNSASFVKILGEVTDGQVGSTLLLADADENGAKEIYSLTSEGDLFFIDVTQSLAGADWPVEEISDSPDDEEAAENDTPEFEEPATNEQASNNNGASNQGADSTENPAEAGTSGCSLASTHATSSPAITLLLFIGIFGVFAMLRRATNDSTSSVCNIGNFQ